MSVNALPLLLAPLLFQGEGPEVKAELIPASLEIGPGEEVFVGVHLTLEPGWHVYWENPGDSGLPTTAQVSGPEGFEISPVLYPAPITLPQPGGLTCYGYEETACLFVRVTAPKELKGESFELTAEVQWLVCEELCFYGEAQLTTTLQRRTEDAVGETDPRLTPHLRRLPQPLSTWPGATIKLGGTLSKPTALITLPELKESSTGGPGRTEVIASFYKSQGSTVEVQSVAVDRNGAALQVSLTCSFKPSEKRKAPAIMGVLAISTEGSKTQRFLTIEPKWPSDADDV